MTYYAFIQNEKIINTGQCKCLNEDVLNIEVDFDIYNNIEKYIYQDGELVLNPNYEKEQEQKERERIAKLYLTGADVERGIYQAKGMDFDDIVEMVETMQFAQAPQVEGIDVKALKIELKANNFYRGNPYVSAIGALLGFTEEQLNQFFETNDYTVLLPKEELTETPNEETFNLEE
jgi:hypothetical protein